MSETISDCETIKKCKKCNQDKPIENFYVRHLKHSDVHENTCKQCLKNARESKRKIPVIRGLALERSLTKDQLKILDEELKVSEISKTKIAKKWRVKYSDLMNYYNKNIQKK